MDERRERELEDEAAVHYQALVDRGVPGPLAAQLAAQRYARRLVGQPLPSTETKPTRARRETK